MKQEILNKHYGQLCQQVGDAHLKLEKLKQFIKDKTDEINALDRLYPFLTATSKEEQND